MLAMICLAAVINFGGTLIKRDLPRWLEISFLGRTANIREMKLILID